MFRDAYKGELTPELITEAWTAISPEAPQTEGEVTTPHSVADLAAMQRINAAGAGDGTSTLSAPDFYEQMKACKTAKELTALLANPPDYAVDDEGRQITLLID
jgi:hypothetical protein